MVAFLKSTDTKESIDSIDPWVMSKHEYLIEWVCYCVETPE